MKRLVGLIILIFCCLMSSAVGSIFLPVEVDQSLQGHNRFVRRISPTLQLFDNVDECIGITGDLTNCQRFCRIRRFLYGGCNFSRQACVCSDRTVDFENYDGDSLALL